MAPSGPFALRCRWAWAGTGAEAESEPFMGGGGEELEIGLPICGVAIIWFNPSLW